jgi:hypothetical protein
MTYKQLIDKILYSGCKDQPVKLMSMHTNDIFKIVALHEATKDIPSEDIKRGDIIFDIELNNY